MEGTSVSERKEEWGREGETHPEEQRAGFAYAEGHDLQGSEIRSAVIVATYLKEGRFRWAWEVLPVIVHTGQIHARKQ